MGRGVLLVVAGEVVVGDARELVDLGVAGGDHHLLVEDLLGLLEVVDGFGELHCVGRYVRYFR